MWHRRPTLAVVTTGVALAALTGALSSAHALWAAAVVVVAVLVAALPLVLTLGWRVGLLVLLIVTCFIDRYTFPVGRFDIRAEQIAVLIALAAMVAARARENPVGWLRPTLAEGFLAAWFAVGFVSSVVAAPDRAHSLKILALLVLSSIALFLPRRTIAGSRDDLEQVIRWFLLAVALESAYAVFIWLLGFFGTSISLSLNRGHLSAYGTLWEPNVLGAICGAGAVAWIFIGARWFKRPWIGVTICLAATVVSWTRTAWLAVAIVLVLALLTPLRRRIGLRGLGLAGLATLVVIGGIIVADKGGKYYPVVIGAPTQANGNPGADLTNLNDVQGRLYQLQPVVVDLRSHLILGGGTDSLPERHRDPLLQHIGNLELMVVNDTGLVGLIVFSAFVMTILLATWRQRQDPMVLGLGATTFVIALTNQATETLELMITWLLIGLLLAAIQPMPAAGDPVSAHTVRYTGS